METSKGRRKRSKTIIIMLLPALILIVIMGWCIYWIGDQKRTAKIRRKSVKKDNVSIMPIVYEDTQEVIDE